MKKLTIGRVLLFCVCLALLAVLVQSFLPQPIEVDIATVARGSFQVSISEDGRTRTKERYVVSAPLAGQLQRIVLKAGDNIARGDTLLATVEPTDPAILDDRARAEAEARVKSAEAAVSRADAQLKRSKSALEEAKSRTTRLRMLMGRQGVTAEDYEQALHREQQANEEVRSTVFSQQIADYELELTRSAFIRTRQRSPGDSDQWRFEIRTPITGRVLRVFQESATVVVPGTKLLEVGDTRELEVEVDLLSSDAVKVKPGAVVVMEHWGGQEPLRGRVRVVEPAAFTKISALVVEEQRVWVIIDFADEAEKRSGLGDGYRVQTRILLAERTDVLKIPASSLFRTGKEWSVFVAKNGRAELRIVSVGVSNGVETEVLTGLIEDEQVVIHPSDKLRNGVGVVIR
jgi:HlyD family secretion protein